MDKIIDLFNTPQAELTYMDQLIIALVLAIPLIIIITIVYFIVERKNRK